MWSLLQRGVDVNVKGRFQMAPLHQAAEKNRIEIVSYLLSETFTNVNARDKMQRTALHIACWKGHAMIVQLLLKGRDIHVNANAAGGITPLHLAAYSGKDEVVRMLVAHQSIELNAKTLAEKFTALHLCANSGHESAVRIILETQCKLVTHISSEELICGIINAEDEINRTPLHYAVWENRVGVVRELLSYSCLRVNSADGDGCSALHLAVRRGHGEIAEMLLENAKIDPNVATARSIQDTHTKVERIRQKVQWDILPRPYSADSSAELSKRRSKVTPLQYAVEENRPEIVSALLAHPYTEVNALDNIQRTALHIACWKGHAIIVQLLLDCTEKRINVNAQAGGGITPLHLAAHSGMDGIVRMLLEHQSIVLDAKTLEEKFTALHLCASSGHESTVRLILEAQRQLATQSSSEEHICEVINAEDEIKRTPLHYAVWENQVGVVRELLSCPSLRVNSADGDGCSALHLAVQRGHGEIAEMLLKNAEIDPNVVTARSNQDTHTKVDRIRQNVQWDILPRPYSADSSAQLSKRRSKVTPLHYAAEENRVELVSAILAHPNTEVNARDNIQRTALHIACWKGHAIIVQLLLKCKEKRINVNAHARGGITPLHLAAHCGKDDVVRMLLGHQSIDLDAKTLEEKFTPLHLCASSGYERAVQLILQAQREKFADAYALKVHMYGVINAEDEIKRTPLHYAAWDNRVEVVKELLTFPSLCVNAADGDGCTALHLAARRGHRDIVAMLMENAEIDPTLATTRSNQDMQIKVEKIQQNVQWDLLPRIKLADHYVLFSELRSQVTPLHYAVEENRIEVVSALLVHPSIDLNARDKIRRTVLHIACWKGHAMIVQLLLDSRETGIDVNAQATGGITPLHLAAYCRKDDVVRMLVAHQQIDLDAITSQEKFTALHSCASCGYENGVRLILQAQQSLVARRSSDQHMGRVINAEDVIKRTPLHYAAWENRVEVVRELLIWPWLRVNAVDVDGCTALHLAARKGNHEIVDMLLENVNIDPNVVATRSNRDTQTKMTHIQQNVPWDLLPRPNLAHYHIKYSEGLCTGTPLHYAVEENQTEVVSAVLVHPSINLNARDEMDRTVLHIACWKGRAMIVQVLLDCTKKAIDVNAQARGGITPLHLAAYCGKDEVVRTLVDHHQIDLDAKTLEEKFTALHLCAISGHESSLRLILTAQLSLERLSEEDMYSHINPEDEMKRTPLHYAAWENRVDVVKKLLTCTWLRVNCVDVEGCTALHLAGQRGNHKIVTLLLEDARIDPNVVATRSTKDTQPKMKQIQQNVHWDLFPLPNLNDYYNLCNKFRCTGTALHYAVQANRTDVISALLAHRSIDVNASTPLHYAVQKNRTEVVSAFLAHPSIHVNGRDEMQRTALHIASWKGHARIVQLLLEYTEKGIDVNAQAVGGITPLHLAAYCGKDDVVGMLVADQQIDLEAETLEEKFTVLHMCAIKGYKSTISLILKTQLSLGRLSEEDKYGIINAEDEIKRTPLHYAAWDNQVEVVKELLIWPWLRVNSVDVDGCTALHLAVRRRNQKIVEMLLENAKIDPNICATRTNTAIQTKMKQIQQNVQWDLLPRPNLAHYYNMYSESCCTGTPLHYAVEKNSTEVSTLLAHSSIKVNAQDEMQRTALHIASCEGYAKIVQVLLACNKKGINVNAQARGGITPLHLAAYFGKNKVVEMLVAHKHIDLDAKTSQEKSTALHLCAIHGYKSTLRLILAAQLRLQRSSDEDMYGVINAEDEIKRTPLHYAAWENQVEVVRELLINGWVRVNSVDVNGCTALHLAACRGHVEIVTMLLKYQDINVNAAARTSNQGTETKFEQIQENVQWDLLPRPNLTDYYTLFSDSRGKFTPLHYAADENRTEVVSALLAHPSIDVNAGDHIQRTALHIACWKGHAMTVQRLLDCKEKAIDVNAQAIGGITPLHLAAYCGKNEVVGMLVAHQHIDLNAKTSQEKFTALHLCAIHRDNSTFSLILGAQLRLQRSSGEDMYGVINSEDEIKRTPLHYAAWENQEEVVRELLICAWVRVNSVDVDGCTALHLAARRGHVEIVKLFLIYQEISVNAVAGTSNQSTETKFEQIQQNFQWDLLPRPNLADYYTLFSESRRKFTPLHYAAEENQTEVVSALLEHPVIDVNAKDHTQRTALHIACWKGHAMIVHLLLDCRKGIEVNAQATGGITPLHLGAYCGKDEVVRILVAHRDIDLDAKILEEKSTALHLCASSGFESSFRLILEAQLRPGRLSEEQMYKVVNAEDKMERTPLHYAAWENRVEVVREILKCKWLLVNFVDKHGCTALHLAGQRGHEEIVRMLLGNRGINVNAASKGSYQDAQTKVEQIPQNVQWDLFPQPNLADYYILFGEHQSKFTPLHYAAEENQTEVVSALLDNSLIDVNAKDHIERTALHIACWKGHAMTVQRLLDCKEKAIDVNAQAIGGITPLHLAAYCGKDEVVGMLVAHQHIDLNAKTSEEEFTVLHLCASSGHESSFGLILEAQLRPGKLSEEQMYKVVNAEDKMERTPLHYAAWENRVEVVRKLLICQWLHVNSVDVHGCTALHLAGRRKHGEIIAMLLEYSKIDVNVGARTSNQSTQREVKQMQQTVQWDLLPRPNLADYYTLFSESRSRSTPLHYATEENQTEVVSALLAHRFILVNAQDHMQYTALHIACMRGHADIVRQLLNWVDVNAKGSDQDVNAKDSHQETPLHFAVSGGKTEVVKLLMGASTLRANMEDKYGRTALQISVEKGKEDIEKLLLDRVDVRAYVDRLYTDRQVYVDAANAILVGAALIASVTFAGWLQPPLGYSPYYEFVVPAPAPPGTYENYASVQQHITTRVFWVCNSLSFFFAVATVMSGAGAVLPMMNVFIKEEVREVKKSLVRTSVLLVFAVIFVLGAFVAAGFAALPPIIYLEVNMIVTCVIGLVVCLGMLWSFLKRLYKIKTAYHLFSRH